MKEESKKNKTLADFPGEFCITGSVLGRNHETRTWKDKETGEEKTLELEVLYVRSDFGVCIVRAFNPSSDMSVYSEGEAVCFPIERFEKQNGVKNITVRI